MITFLRWILSVLFDEFLGCSIKNSVPLVVNYYVDSQFCCFVFAEFSSH